MDEVKIGDKVRIVCPDGNSNNATVSIDGQALKWVTGVNIRISPDSFAKAELKMIAPVIDCEATITKIIDDNPKLNEIRKIITEAEAELKNSGSIDARVIKAVALSNISRIVNQETDVRRTKTK